VVGPLELVPLLPPGTSLTVEEPPGSGPVAGLAAGLALLPDVEKVAVVGGDLPFLDASTVDLLRSSLSVDHDGAVLVDDGGRPQWLCGVWWHAALRDRLAKLGDPAGRSLRELVAGLRVAHVSSPLPGPPAWFDCDTADDLRLAEEMADGGTG
ncbi:MAG TPA: NTP transferase domain-containing protein, partial [Micromonosporaceae bacterium]|nr:NTP transferase domain-containing protein [Micromonosporaceae bacterium]